MRKVTRGSLRGVRTAKTWRMVGKLRQGDGLVMSGEPRHHGYRVKKRTGRR